MNKFSEAQNKNQQKVQKIKILNLNCSFPLALLARSRECILDIKICININKMHSKQSGNWSKNLYLNSTASPKTTRNRGKMDEFSKNLHTYTPKHERKSFFTKQNFIQRYGSSDQFYLKSAKKQKDPTDTQLSLKDRSISVKTTISIKNPLHINPQESITERFIDKNSKNHTETTVGSSIGTESPIQKRDLAEFKSKRIQTSYKYLQQSSKLELKNFQIIKKLGKGKFGSVFLVREKLTNFTLALKVVDKQKIIGDGMLNQFIRQLKIQSFLVHSNVIQNYGFFQDKKHFYILMELGSDGQLYKLMMKRKIFSEESVSYIIKSLLSTTEYLHNLGIIHRDLKPENIVLIMGTLKICDFGWAVKRQKLELRNTYCGTPFYLSPEMIKDKGYDEKIDVWAIGVMAFELIFGHSPFNISNTSQLHKILTQQLKIPYSRIVSAEFIEFLYRILNKNPYHRSSSKQLQQLKFITLYEYLEVCCELCV